MWGRAYFGCEVSSGGVDLAGVLGKEFVDSSLGAGYFVSVRVGGVDAGEDFGGDVASCAVLGLVASVAIEDGFF